MVRCLLSHHKPCAERLRVDLGTFGNGPFNSTEDFTLYDRCITRGIIGSVMRVIYGNGNRIVQAPGVVAISYEMVHDTRVIYTDGRPHISGAIRNYLGDSRARWDGDVLVVETTNLTDRTSIGLNGNGLRHSDTMKLTERFKRVSDDVLQYQVTVDDPVTYTRPFTISMPLTPLSGGALLPYDCHEGNYAIRQSLGAERAEDRAMEEDRVKGIIRARRPVQELTFGQQIGDDSSLLQGELWDSGASAALAMMLNAQASHAARPQSKAGRSPEKQPTIRSRPARRSWRTAPA